MTSTMQKAIWSPENIRALRQRYGETQEEFAAHFGLSPDAVRKWEKTKKDGGSPPSGAAVKILQILKLNADGEADLAAVIDIFELHQLQAV